MPYYVLRGQWCPSSRLIQPYVDSNGRLAHFFFLIWTSWVGCDSPLQIVMTVWRTFFFNLNFLGRVWQPSSDSNGSLAHFFKNLNILGRVWQLAADNNGLWRFKLKKNAPNSQYYLQRAVTTDQIIHRIVCRGQEGPKGSKGTLRPDFQVNTRP